MSCGIRFPTIRYVRPAKAQTSLRIPADWSDPLHVAWIFNECYTTDRTSFIASKLKRRLHRLIYIYTCRNTTLLEITCQDSYFRPKLGTTRYIYVLRKVRIWTIPESLCANWDFLTWRTEWEFLLCAVQFRNCPCAKWESGQSENRSFVICFAGKIDMGQRFPNFYKVVQLNIRLKGKGYC